MPYAPPPVRLPRLPRLRRPRLLTIALAALCLLLAGAGAVVLAGTPGALANPVAPVVVDVRVHQPCGPRDLRCGELSGAGLTAGDARATGSVPGP